MPLRVRSASDGYDGLGLFDVCSRASPPLAPWAERGSAAPRNTGGRGQSLSPRRSTSHVSTRSEGWMTRCTNGGARRKRRADGSGGRTLSLYMRAVRRLPQY
eukprot:scaffold3423_cov379-Prasinococcus_capsulatus_cf.AAC.3